MAPTELTLSPSWLSSVLDPTTLAFNFDQSCLQGLDDVLLHSPREAFAARCWETGITANSPSTATKETKNALVEDAVDFLSHSRRSYISFDMSEDDPIPVFLIPSVWTEDSDSEESDSDESYEEDDVYSNGTITGAHPEMELKEMLFYVDDLYDDIKPLSLFQNTFSYSNMNSDRSKGVGAFPTPVVRRNKTVSGRIASFCANTRMSLVRAGSLSR